LERPKEAILRKYLKYIKQGRHLNYKNKRDRSWYDSIPIWKEDPHYLNFNPMFRSCSFLRKNQSTERIRQTVKYLPMKFKKKEI